ncbi:hypothetical protein IWX50DRAFT_10766 [Phyllosticta citricarpa]
MLSREPPPHSSFFSHLQIVWSFLSALSISRSGNGDLRRDGTGLSAIYSLRDYASERATSLQQRGVQQPASKPASTQTSKQASKQSSTRRRTSCTIQQQLTGQVGGSAQTASDGNIAKLLGFWICCCSSWRKKFWTVDFFFPPSHPSLLLPFDFLLFLSHIASFLFTHAGLGSGSVELGSLRTRAIYHHIHTHYATRARAPTPLRLHWVALLGWAAPARGLIILLISFELAAALHCAHVFLHRYHQPDSSFVAFDEDTDGSSYG